MGYVLKMDNIYERQRELPLSIPESIGIIGAGGVGSWVALGFGLTGTKQMCIVDDDIIEAHNLNRTPFKASDVGNNKATATAGLIYERRGDISIFPLENKVEGLGALELKELLKSELIIDCRDTVMPLPKKIMDKIKVKTGYDGDSITLHFNPNYNNVWGDEPVRYTVTPSWLVPPMLLSALVISCICKNIKLEKEVITTIKLNDILDKIIGGTNDGT